MNRFSPTLDRSRDRALVAVTESRKSAASVDPELAALSYNWALLAKPAGASLALKFMSIRTAIAWFTAALPALPAIATSADYVRPPGKTLPAPAMELGGNFWNLGWHMSSLFSRFHESEEGCMIGWRQLEVADPFGVGHILPILIR